MRLPDRTAPALCPSCNAPLTMAQRDVTGHCGAPHCARQQAAAAARATEHRRQMRDAMRSEAIAKPLRATAARRFGTAEDNLRVMTLPYQNAPLTPLPDAARTAFLTALRAVVDAGCGGMRDTVQAVAGQVDTASGDAATRAERLGAIACAACQGHCCRYGRTQHAFLRPDDIARLVEARPDVTPAAIMDHYTSALPAQSWDDSCVFHGAEGCTLDRDWRSATCNAYRCPSLVSLANETADEQDRVFLLVAMTEDDAQVVAYRQGAPALTLDPAPLPPATRGSGS